MKSIVRLALAAIGLLTWPALCPAEKGKPAAVNPYNGMRSRDEVFEFTEKPKVERQGETWAITFASKAK